MNEDTELAEVASTMVTEEPEKVLRQVGRVDTTILIGGQVKVYEDLIEFVEGEGRMHVLEGFAGTGKSFIINMLMEDIINRSGCYLCAIFPTHKSRAVVQQMAEFKSDNLDYSTVHSLLGLRPVVTSHGNEKFIKDSQNKNAVEDYEILILDETSQLDDQLFVYLQEELEDNPRLKIIFVGDGKQLPPVNHISSIPLDKEARKKYKITYSPLTEIIRQKETNPIIAFSKKLRKGIFEPISSFNEEKEGIVVVRGKEQKAKVLKLLFATDKYDKDPNYARVTAYRNDCVDNYNNMIRKMIYANKIRTRIDQYTAEGMGNREMRPKLIREFPYWNNGKMQLTKFVVGDKLIVDKPIFGEDGKEIILRTNEEVILEDFYLETRMGLGNTYKCYIATVKNLFSSKLEFVEMVHEDDSKKFEHHMEKLKEAALREKQGTKKARDKWIVYYELDKRFARMKYAPALTTYKAQGSTYENIVLIVPDIMSHRKQREMFQHLYVGVTRASKRAFLFMD